MQHLILTTLLILSALPAQEGNINPLQEQNGYYLDATKPSVYLRREQETDLSQARFRLFNNGRWAIRINLRRLLDSTDTQRLELQDGQPVAAVKDSVTIHPAYFIYSPLLEPGLIHRHECAQIDGWVPAGQSIIFEVPLSDLPKLAEIYLPFHYEWEHLYEESEHRVKFRWFDPSLVR